MPRGDRATLLVAVRPRRLLMPMLTLMLMLMLMLMLGAVTGGVNARR